MIGEPGILGLFPDWTVRASCPGKAGEEGGGLLRTSASVLKFGEEPDDDLPLTTSAQPLPVQRKVHSQC